MEFSSEHSRFGLKTELECALEQDFTGLELQIRGEIDDGALGAIQLSNEEKLLATGFYKTLNNVPEKVDEELCELAERAVKLAKLLYRKTTRAELPALFKTSEMDGEDEIVKFAQGVYRQLESFDGGSPATADLIHRLNVELDFSGDHSHFAVAAVKLGCIAIEHTTLVQSFHEQRTHESFDDELVLWLGEAS